MPIVAPQCEVIWHAADATVYLMYHLGGAKLCDQYSQARNESWTVVGIVTMDTVQFHTLMT